LGDRTETPGKERATLSGTLTDGGGSTSVTIIYELTGKVLIERGGGRAVGFDGSRNWTSTGNAAESDEILLEAFGEDSPEGLLNSLLNGAGLRVLGRFFRMDDGLTPNYAGPWVDVFQVVAQVRSRSARPLRQKHFYFDSQNHLLSEVRYISTRADRSTAAVQVKRSGWRSVAGQMVPGTITRVENGSTVFVVQVVGASFRPAAQDNTFSPR
jgi:hypothetical protein